MMNVLYKNIDWTKVLYIGFDMDGTLYDEYDFIYQVYLEINNNLIKDDKVLSFMLFRWLEKGSSYPYIFDEAYEKIPNISLTKDVFVSKALEVFRNFTPSLTLSLRTKSILEYCKKHYEIFLVTDGNYILQEKKFASLGLSQYFEEKNTIFTGKYGVNYHKPNNKALELLDIDSNYSLFFGDRKNDEEFAFSSNMQFQKVHNMKELVI